VHVTQRSYEEHVRLFVAYAAAVAALPHAAWDRLAAGCARLDGDAITTVVRRARLSAKAHNIAAGNLTHSRLATTIAGVTTATMTGMSVALELLAEFDSSHADAPGSPAVSAPTQRPAASNDASVNAFVDAWFVIEASLRRFPLHSGVAAAVRTAGQAVVHHDWLSPAAFAEVYGFVEAEIPYATVDPGT
jgi:hypothetical protein